ncbi:MAG: (2Fe-2S)-binding protein [Desulfobacterales bacterium]|jgi:NADH dehydrogenase/NADH:ubiquinone oxidoreductase subunit G|nr:(2Fe-2S)-binding protein [Desulfobacteraceae bacterium]MBT4364437.1 (2Fe-2S)-binding protein [Desulfobacteraceae bacterium]MBT7698199.1 (2Fe-2S)-binding protein [Desulfobacterales bacterium]
MTQQVTLNIDGALIRAAKGTSVLDAALDFGICIPHLCHVSNIEDIGSCRLCIVENIVNGRSKITTSCTLLVQDDMMILSNTDKIRRLRHNIAELLVSEAPNSRAMQDIALRCGVEETRYSFRNNDCILCGRCVRACTGEFGVKPLGFVGRGKDRRVEAPFNLRSKLCNECGRCIDLCPMVMPACDGPMETGKERLCGNCESKLSDTDLTLGYCVGCYFGEGIQCQRSPINV